ncbi:MAG: response regulator [Myxococcales bacterium]|nr:response regulator [Myxococcales bacterium]
MPLRVLIVDDSNAMRAFVRAALEDDPALQAQVEEAESGFEALRVLPRQTFDLVVLDVNMPNINGLELIPFIRSSERHAQTPLLMISTEASERDRERALSLGANRYLSKPFSSEQLVDMIRQLRADAADAGGP